MRVSDCVMLSTSLQVSSIAVSPTTCVSVIHSLIHPWTKVSPGLVLLLSVQNVEFYLYPWIPP
jgi:hypothetical protein